MSILAAGGDEITSALNVLRENRDSEAAWKALYTHSWPRAYAVAYRELRGMRTPAEDVAQNTFVKLYLDVRFPSNVGDTEHYLRYLKSMVRNSCVDLWREDARRPELSIDERALAPELVADDATVSPQRHIELEELRNVIRRELGKLSAGDRRLIELLQADHPRAAIALELGQSYGAIVVRLHRIRQRLRKALAENHLTVDV